MPLRRYQPISRSGQWSETVDWPDPRTRKLNSLDGATLTLALYQHDWGCRRDYGFVGYGDLRAVLTAQTQADGSGPFVIKPDGLHAQFTFPAGSLSRLRAGDAHLMIWATVDGATDPITDVTIPVLDGPRALPVIVPTT